MKKRKKPSYLDIRAPLYFCVIAAILIFAANAVLCGVTDYPPLNIGIVSGVLYLYVSAAVFVAVRNKIRKVTREIERRTAVNTELSSMFEDVLDVPAAVVAQDGSVRYTNRYLEQLTDKRATTDEICSAPLADILEANAENGGTEKKNGAIREKAGLRVSVGKRHFLAKSYPMNIKGERHYLVIFGEITKQIMLEDKMARENPVVAFIVIDNLEELAQYVRVSNRSAANEIESILKKWASSVNAIIREYDRDKFLVFMSEENLEKCVKDKFDILNSVRNVKLGDDNMSVTVSMGIYAGGGSFPQREREATIALEMALSRGGDQVALRRAGEDLKYFGGQSKSIQKRTKVKSRVTADMLLARIPEASNVLVMGHKNPDFDCIGSCVGIARLAMHCGVPVKIVSDLNCANFAVMTENLSKHEEYADMFTDARGGLGLVRPETLLIICDANNFNILEAPAIADKAKKIAIIDHHRQTAKFDFDPVVCYIDPSASSACEIVAEILEHTLPVGELTGDEATAMLAGIMLDTKHFSLETGPRTFAAAFYLENEGAKAEEAKAMFNENFEEFMAEAKFGGNIKIYKDYIAITESEGTGNDEFDRAAAAKAADRLLNVREVKAAFALVYIDDEVRISARSSGEINVQLILEQLGGGGHFDAAGAMVKGTMESAYESLLAAIDGYLAVML